MLCDGGRFGVRWRPTLLCCAGTRSPRYPIVQDPLPLYNSVYVSDVTPEPAGKRAPSRERLQVGCTVK